MQVDTLASFVTDEALGIVAGAAVIAVPHVIVARAAMLAAPVLSGKVSEGAQWYGARWARLLGEAQIDWNARQSDSLTLAGLLASMGQAEVISDTPGRARLRIVHLKGRPDRSVFMADAVATMPGVHKASASPLTGTVLVQYDTTRYVSLDALLEWIVAS